MRSDFSLNPIKCHEEVLSMQPVFSSKRLTISPLSGGCSEGLDALRFFFKHVVEVDRVVAIIISY